MYAKVNILIAHRTFIDYKLNKIEKNCFSDNTLLDVCLDRSMDNACPPKSLQINIRIVQQVFWFSFSEASNYQLCTEVNAVTLQS